MRKPTEKLLRNYWNGPIGLLWIYINLSKELFAIKYLNEKKYENIFRSSDNRLNSTYEEWLPALMLDFDGWISVQSGRFGATHADVGLVELTRMDQIGSTGFELDDWIYLKIPVGGGATELQRQFAELLSTHERRHAALFAAKQATEPVFVFSHHKSTDIGFYRKSAELWLTHQLEVEMHAGSNKKPTLWELGERIGVSEPQTTHDSDSQEVKVQKRNGMKVTVSRMLKRANALIANVEIGKFPSYDVVERADRWTPEQLQDLNRPSLAAAWEAHLNEVLRQIGNADNGLFD
jgi:hypothetical protein